MAVSRARAGRVLLCALGDGIAAALGRALTMEGQGVRVTRDASSALRRLLVAQRAATRMQAIIATATAAKRDLRVLSESLATTLDSISVSLPHRTVLVRRDGTESPISDSCSPIRAADGTVEGAVLVFHHCSAERDARDFPIGP